MPLIKTIRDDVLRPHEIEAMIKKAKYDPGLQCLVALLAIFGKRISENITLKRKHLWIEEEYLCVRFHVLKKASVRAQPVPKLFLKRKTVKHPFVKYVRDYVVKISDPESFLFPSNRSRAGIIQVRNKTSGKVYSYQKMGGCITRQHAYNQLKNLNSKVWCHLFRHSLATDMAEHGATVADLMNWFDWDRVETAIGYVRRGTKLAEKWSDRT